MRFKRFFLTVVRCRPFDRFPADHETRKYRRGNDTRAIGRVADEILRSQTESKAIEHIDDETEEKPRL